jgi:FKBP-type peptidyl-prolyl cis-trans isomerase FkpA
MKKIILYCAVAAMVCTVFSCIKNDTGCPYKDLNTTAPAGEVAKVKHYLDSVGVNALKDSASGLYYIIQTPGSGTTPEVCSVVSVNYVGRLTNDSIFDKTNGTPVNFRLGDLIAGWQKGLPYIKPGGRLKLFVPPTLGYGAAPVTKTDQSTGVTTTIIPGNSILIFDLELVGVQ